MESSRSHLASADITIIWHEDMIYHVFVARLIAIVMSANVWQLPETSIFQLGNTVLSRLFTCLNSNFKHPEVALFGSEQDRVRIGCIVAAHVHPYPNRSAFLQVVQS